MSLDDIFGPFPGRPQHPDMAILADVILQLDGKTEDPDFNLPDFVGKDVDFDCLLHLAKQRCLRVTRDPEMAVVIAIPIYLDAFMAGLAYANRKHQGA
jgi:hypothetical protein